MVVIITVLMYALESVVSLDHGSGDRAVAGGFGVAPEFSVLELRGDQLPPAHALALLLD